MTPEVPPKSPPKMRRSPPKMDAPQNFGGRNVPPKNPEVPPEDGAKNNFGGVAKGLENNENSNAHITRVRARPLLRRGELQGDIRGGHMGPTPEDEATASLRLTSGVHGSLYRAPPSEVARLGALGLLRAWATAEPASTSLRSCLGWFDPDHGGEEPATWRRHWPTPGVSDVAARLARDAPTAAPAAMPATALPQDPAKPASAPPLRRQLALPGFPPMEAKHGA